MLLITLFLVGLIVWLLNYWVNSKFQYWKKTGIHYSQSSPFRQIFLHIFTKKSFIQQIQDIYDTHKGHKFIGQFQILTPIIMIRDPDLLYNVCIKDFSYFSDRNLPSEVTDLLTESVGNLTGSRWRVTRHKLTPTFTSGKLKMMFALIKENCDDVVSFVNQKISHDIDARDIMHKFVVNVTGNVLFGLKVDALNEKKEDTNQFFNVCKSCFKSSPTILLKFLITMTMPKIRKIIRFQMVDSTTDTFFRNLVNDLIAHREKTQVPRNDFLQLMLDLKKKEQTELLGNSRQNDKKIDNSIKEQEEEPEDKELLEQLKYMGNKNENYKSTNVFTDDCIISQTFAFITGGSETTAAALSFVLFELAANPDLQKKVQNEVDNEICKEGFSYQAVKHMTYLDNFIQETLRLHPIAPGLTRICTKNYQVPDTNVIIEKGTVIALPVQQMMKDAQYFPEPEKFNPDRFDGIEAIHPAVLLSFGIGPRMCIAKRLAMLEMKMVVAALLQSFTIKLSPKTKLPLTILKTSVFQHVEGGIWVQFETRKKTL